MNKRARSIPACLLMAWACSALAVDNPVTLESCTTISDDRNRLACFDQLAAHHGTEKQRDLNQAPSLLSAEVPSKQTPSHQRQESTSALASDWELDQENKQGIFKYRPHRGNYIIATYNPSPNIAPYGGFDTPLAPERGDLSKAELAFQLSFKLKLIENAFSKPVDLWFGYTQNSFWQALNDETSGFFRATDYQPELMAVVPLDWELLGLRAKFINFGITHQSNGQIAALSRNWNRIYTQVGLERGNFTLLARVWKRVLETDNDDNPDIIEYMGNGDLNGTYRWNKHELSFLTRYNFDTDRGAAQLGWTFPLATNLKGYLQYFSGYGKSLIDYNDYQRTIGLGVLIDY